jgi:hypothetical protein
MRVGGRFITTKGVEIFVEYDIARHIDPSCGSIETTKASMVRTIPEEHTQTRTKTEFVVVIRPKVRPTRAPKHVEGTVVNSLFE